MTLPDPGEWPVEWPLEPSETDVLRRRTRSTPDRTAILDADTGDRLTYAELDGRVDDRLATLEAVRKSGPGRVGSLLASGVPFVETYFATERAGVAAVPLNLRLDRETLATQAQRSALRALVCDGDTEADAVAVAPEGCGVVSVDGSTTDGSRYSGVRSPDVQSAVDGAGRSERLLMFTSGTTGEPKAVRLTRRNLVASAVGSADRLDVSPRDRWLVCLPMYHMGGLAPVVRSTLYGTTTVIQRAFDPAETARVIDEYDVTCVSLVPTMLTRLLDADWSPPEELRFVLLGGGPTPPALVDRCEERGVPVCPTYGATETASQVATARPDAAFARRGTVGRPLRWTDVEILDDSGEACEPGSVGEIVVDGPTVSPGYLDDERTAAAFGDRGFETGDLGYRDGEGRLWVVGRVDDRIITGGENVQPARVESTIRDVDGVSDVVVLGVSDDEWGERVCALVESDDASLSVSQVDARCRDTLAEFEVPKTVRLTDALPRTASGTVDREAARRMLREE